MRPFLLGCSVMLSLCFALIFVVNASAHTVNHTYNVSPVIFPGHAHVDIVYGGPGRDYLAGQGSNDKLFGRGGNDDLHGAGGADRLIGGSGIDFCYGGPGLDYIECEYVSWGSALALMRMVG